MQQTTLFTTDRRRANLRLVLAAEFLCQFQLLYIHIPGVTNVVADMLSRIPSGNDHPDPEEPGQLDKIWDESAIYWSTDVGISPEMRKRIRRGYKDVPKWKGYIDMLKTADPDFHLPFNLDQGLLYFVETSGKQKLCVPNEVAQDLIAAAHDENQHYGDKRVWYELQDKFVINNMMTKIKKYRKTCPVCGPLGKDRGKPIGSLQPIITPPIPFHTITMDFITGLPEVSADNTIWKLPGFAFYDSVMTVTDKFSKSTMIVPGNTSYTAAEWALNNAYVATIKCSPNELVYGFKTNGPLDLLGDVNIISNRDLLQEEAKISIAEGQMHMKQIFDKEHRHIVFGPGDFVHLRLGKGYRLPGKPSPKTSPQYTEPIKVLERVGPLAYRLDLPPTMNVHPVISIAYLIPATNPQDDPFRRTPLPAIPVDVDDPRQAEWRDWFAHYEIERILDKRVLRRGRGSSKTQYLIKWKDFPHFHNVWMDADAMEANEGIAGRQSEKERQTKAQRRNNPPAHI
ncbi:Transposon Tf2-11 polyprotein [Colletotrichum gloeosporioides]|uniref:Transposon Tf2-11 polyprotein n=1 Tax=Colletotrichum gloeosporioides TaxID=474922 RepID=A0A8H4CHF8_COLGL|nr:Transposon Tf2-11 polyprotein [Colletotrichum gloeosporioides]KAF3803874.1 Transposon Tf2-11 polyprotein [Colletotrichum gloeosporioides]